MSITASPELAEQISQVKSMIGNNTGSLRSLSNIAYNLSFPDSDAFVDYIWDRDVLDAGSGLNGLAIAVILKKIPARITSINPAFNHPEFETIQKDMIARVPRLLPDSAAEEIEAARIKANSNTFALFAHDLSRFADKSFEVVVDNYAVTQYTQYNWRLAYAKSLEEMSRVCRGRIRVGYKPVEIGSMIPQWQVAILQDLGLKYTPYRGGFEVIL